MVVSFDTMTLIWGIKGEAANGQADNIPLAKDLIKRLQADKVQVVLAAPVVAEFVGGFPVSDQPAQLAAITQQFVVRPFDTKAAAIAAKLLYSKKAINGIRDEFKSTRQLVKADLKIVATCIAFNVDAIYSEDPHFRKCALGKILIRKLTEQPPSPDELRDAKSGQKSLFGDSVPSQ